MGKPPRRQLEPAVVEFPAAPGHWAESWFDSAILALADGLGVGVTFAALPVVPALAEPVGCGVALAWLALGEGFGAPPTGALGAVVSAAQSAPSTDSVCTIDWASDRLVAVIEARTRL